SVQIVTQVDSIPGVVLGPLLVAIRVRDGHGKTLLDEERVEPAPLAGAPPRFLIKNFRTVAEKVRVRVRAKGIDFDGKGEAEFELELPAFSKEAFPVTTPRLGILPELTGDDPDSLERAFEPRPSHRFRSEGDPITILLGLGRTGVNLRTDVPDSLRGRFTLRRDSRTVKDSTFVCTEDIHDLLFRENARRWGEGRYTFQIALSSGGATILRRGAFEILAGGSDILRDPVLVRTVLGYIATGEERLGLETATTDSLPSLWQRFWERRDPSPGTGINEALERFLDRVERTEKLGGVVPGWRSDQGRILIQYGEPERTEESVDPGGRTRTQIWYYDSRHKSYVFQDMDGFGNYQLVGGR
ncbi:MAG TPA: GWxTD domain-containing protein, partial [Candidatus Eisenbacteria bacterium]|nr:GWxTD domain-containing protein [Candidatus Eisenbacteria bacterium]